MPTAWNKGLKMDDYPQCGFQKGHSSYVTDEVKKRWKGRTAWNKGTKGLMKAWNKGLKGSINKGGFKKGHKPFYRGGSKKGHFVSSETKKKIGKKHKGIKLSKEHIENLKKSHLGYVMPESQKQKIREKMKGGNSTSFNKESVGEKAGNWQGGITDRNRYRRERRNRENNSEGFHTFGEWELLKKQYGYTCPACGKKEPEIKLTEDHIIPLSKGGSDYIENIQPLCCSCNSRKHTKTRKYNIK